jgi:hypothetical protein
MRKSPIPFDINKTDVLDLLISLTAARVRRALKITKLRKIVLFIADKTALPMLER